MSWYEALKDAMNAAEQLKDAKLTKVLATLMMEGAKLAQENADLREQLVELKETARLRGAMHFRDNSYWQHGEGAEEGPYCAKCWPSDSKAVRLVDRGSGLACPVCGLYVDRPGHARFGSDDFGSPGRPDWDEQV